MTDTLERGLIAGPNPPDPNGWQRTAVDAGTNMAGDDALMEYTAYYQNGDQLLEVTYYAVAYPLGCDAEDVEDYGVHEQSLSYRVGDDGEMIDGTEEWDYSGMGWPYTLDSLDAACAKARMLAMEDEAWKLG